MYKHPYQLNVPDLTYFTSIHPSLQPVSQIYFLSHLLFQYYQYLHKEIPSCLMMLCVNTLIVFNVILNVGVCAKKR